MTKHESPAVFDEVPENFLGDKMYTNFPITSADLADTLYCKKGYCQTDSDRDTLMYIMGMDVKRGYDYVYTDTPQTHRSQFNNQVCSVQEKWVGYERTDEAYLNNPTNWIKYLYTEDGVEQLRSQVLKARGEK